MSWSTPHSGLRAGSRRARVLGPAANGAYLPHPDSCGAVRETPATLFCLTSAASCHARRTFWVSTPDAAAKSERYSGLFAESRDIGFSHERVGCAIDSERRPVDAGTGFADGKARAGRVA